ncbi:hypothetical protein SISSUDRAFT_1044333, partial [Sistotremastrum suecicum HHB10207 ss-3]
MLPVVSSCLCLRSCTITEVVRARAQKPVTSDPVWTTKRDTLAGTLGKSETPSDSSNVRFGDILFKRRKVAAIRPLDIPMASDSEYYADSSLSV